MSITNEALIEHLITQQDLDVPKVRELMERILSGSMPPAQIAASLVLLRSKKESAVEISESARVVLSKANPIKRPDYLFADVVGTGGDGHNTINVSTLASITAASMGLPIAKHGNVSVSSKCGSADLLRAWGIDIDVSADQSRALLDQLGWCFLFAPLYHPTFKTVKPLRQELRIKTIFNILGPLVNPIAPPIMLVGVYDPRLMMPFAEALKALGRVRVLIVHGSGLDEIALHGPTQAVLADDRSIEQFVIRPEELRLSSFPISAVAGALPEDNARIGLDVLSGTADAAKTSMIAASTGALLWLSDRACQIADGVELALDALRAGHPRKQLERIRGFRYGA